MDQQQTGNTFHHGTYPISENGLGVVPYLLKIKGGNLHCSEHPGYVTEINLKPEDFHPHLIATLRKDEDLSKKLTAVKKDDPILLMIQGYNKSQLLVYRHADSKKSDA